MADLFEVTSQVTNGRIHPDDAKIIGAAIRRLDGKRVTITVKKHVNKRSLGQNAYYWTVIVPLILEMFVEAGNDTNRDEIHEYLKEHVGGSIFARVLVDPDGKRRPVVRSSTTLNTQEWEDFTERIRAWAAERDVIIPLPNEHLIPQGE